MSLRSSLLMSSIGRFVPLTLRPPAAFLLLGPEQVVRLLAHLGAARPRPGAGDRVADAHRRGLGAGEAGQAERRRQGSGGADEGAS